MAMCKEALDKGFQDHTLVFEKAHLLKGLNVTIRSGLKWKEKLNPGDTLLLVDRGGKPFNNARVLSTEALDLKAYEPHMEYLLNWEHDPNSRNIKGLKESLNNIYGRYKWGPTVTAILFWIDDVDPNNHSSHSTKHISERNINE